MPEKLVFWIDLSVGEIVKAGDRFYNPKLNEWVVIEKEDLLGNNRIVKNSDLPHQRKVSPESELVKVALADKAKLEVMVDNAYMALDAVKSSGAIMNEDVYEMIELGFNNQPQKPDTRLG